MFKLIGSESKHLAASCGSLFIGTLMLYGIVGIAVTPNSSLAASDRSKATLNRWQSLSYGESNVPTRLIAGESGQSIMTTSGASELALVKHLNKKGVRMHGAFWCGACSKQKTLFGKEAFAKLKYIECDPRGINPKPQVCSNVGVRAYPTWKFPNGNTNAGVLSLSVLADSSGYTGPRNFKN
jgi:hypothetical protein